MKSPFANYSIAIAALVVSAVAIAPVPTAAADEPTLPLQAGAVLKLGDLQATVTKLDFLPYVESDYTRRFKYDAHDNPKLKELRTRNKLDEVVAPGKDEFDRQVLLLDWVNNRFKKFGTPSSQPKGAAEIIRDIDEGHTFFCAHYADVLVSAAASLGWVDRSLALRRPASEGNGEHSSTEIWSNEYRKWVMLDPTFAMYVEKDGQPLNAYELRQEWYYHDARHLTFVLGKDRQKYKKADMPVFRKRFAGFGDLSLDPSAVNVYAFIGYVPNTDLMDSGPDYGKMFITQDKLCEGTSWHKRVVPAKPAEEPYFPIGQAALALLPQGNGLRVGLNTLTPNFKTYQVRIDGGAWKPSSDAIDWQLHVGVNRLEAKTVNAFDVEGPISTAEVEIKREPGA
jgi:hypothetical protein